MRKLIVTGLSLFIGLKSFSQSDTAIIKGQKGFLFLSAYNYMYDWDVVHSRPLGFHDFFFPSDEVNFSLLKNLDTFINVREGLRVEYFSLRKRFKFRAKAYACIDTTSCYKFDSFYVVPVVITYKVYEDNWPLVCQTSNFEINVGKSNVRFDYQHKAIAITRIGEPLMPGKRKTATNNSFMQ